jgi:hypothetical protein
MTRQEALAAAPVYRYYKQARATDPATGTLYRAFVPQIHPRTPHVEWWDAEGGFVGECFPGEEPRGLDWKPWPEQRQE